MSELIQRDFIAKKGRKLPIFPCNLKKHPLVKSWDQIPSHDFKGIPTSCPPGEMLALVCGDISGVVVVDLDREHGKDGLAEWERRYGELPDTPTVQTPSERSTSIFFKY